MKQIITNSSSRKVAVIGAGYVGASIVYSLVINSHAREIVLIGREESVEKRIAEINDIRPGIPFMGSSNVYTGTYEDIRNCELIIVTVGRNRLQGESRLNLAIDNLKIARNVANEIKKHYNGGIVLVITNPVDIITQKISDWLDLPKGAVFGSGCLLDSSRLTNIIADYLGLRSDVVTATIIGEHGDNQIILWSKVLVAGVPISDYCQKNSIEYNSTVRKSIEAKVKQMGMAIIKGKGRTHYGIATCACYIADTILNRRMAIASVSNILNGEYKIDDIALSLPSVIGTHGVERILTDRLSEFEYTRLKEVETYMKEFIQKIDFSDI